MLAEVAGRGDQPLSEVPVPDAVDEHAGGQRVARLDDGLGQRLPQISSDRAVNRVGVGVGPVGTLAHFHDLALHGSPGLMALLRDQPQLSRMLGTLFGMSDRLSDLLVRHPAMWEPLVGGLWTVHESTPPLSVMYFWTWVLRSSPTPRASAPASAAASASLCMCVRV